MCHTSVSSTGRMGEKGKWVRGERGSLRQKEGHSLCPRLAMWPHCQAVRRRKVSPWPCCGANYNSLL